MSQSWRSAPALLQREEHRLRVNEEAAPVAVPARAAAKAAHTEDDAGRLEAAGVILDLGAD
jgi:hypothetical protein